MNTCKTFQEGVGLVQTMSLPDSSDVDAQMEVGMMLITKLSLRFLMIIPVQNQPPYNMLEDVTARFFNNKLFVFRMRLERWMVLHLLQFHKKATFKHPSLLTFF